MSRAVNPQQLFPSARCLWAANIKAKAWESRNVAFTRKKKMFGSKKIFVLRPVGRSRIRRGLLHASPRCLRQLRANVTYLQSTTIKAKQKSCQLKNTEWFQTTKKSVDIVWSLAFCTRRKKHKKKKKIEAKNRLGAVRQIPSPAKAAAPGSYAALPVQPSLLLSSELYSNLQNVFFSCRNTRISPHPPHLGAHLS